jgi:phage terminase large subunit-like protein
MTRGEKVCAFIEKYCRVPSGSAGAKVGEPIRLVEFQRKFILDIYDNPSGTRRAYLSLARKNGKTALIACLLLAHLVGPEAQLNAQIVSGAMSREQASIVFDLASKMIQLSPELSKIVRIVPSGKRLIGLSMNTEYKALAADGTTAHGLSPVLAILDEVGQVKGPRSDFVDAITTAQGAHENPLLIAISTQAPTDADLFSQWLDKADGNPRIVKHLYTAPEDCALDDEVAWKAANPALDLFRSRQDVEEQATAAIKMPADEPTFRVLTLNQRVNMVSAFVSKSTWQACGGPPEDFQGPVYGGLDLSATTDLTAFVLTCRMNGVCHVKPFFWMPAASVQKASDRDKADYRSWVNQGLLRTTPGPVIDYEYVAHDIMRIVDGLQIVKLGFDRWRMDRLQTEFARIGFELPWEPFGQGYQSMVPAIDALEKDLLLGMMRHGNHPVLAMCAANAVVLPDAAGNRKFDKSKATGRIDGLVALAMAEGVEAMMQEAIPVCPWDDPNFSLVRA